MQPGRNSQTADAKRSDQTARQFAVTDKYARIRNGKPVVCTASPRSPEDEGPRGARVVFRDKTAAKAAATELGEIYETTFRAYPCPRSRHGHYHLTDLAAYHQAGGAADG